MAQGPELSEQDIIRFRSQQRLLGFCLFFIGVALQWIPGAGFWRFFVGWPAAAVGVLLCAQTMLGDAGWSLLSLFPLIGAPLAFLGILVQYKLGGGAVSRGGRRYFLWYEFLVIFIAIALFWGGIAWLRHWCYQNGGCTFG